MEKPKMKNVRELIAEIGDRIVSFYYEIKDKDEIQLKELSSRYSKIKYDPNKDNIPANFDSMIFSSTPCDLGGRNGRDCLLDKPEYRQCRSRILAQVTHHVEKRTGESIEQMIENSMNACFKLFPLEERRLGDKKLLYQYKRVSIDYIFKMLKDLHFARKSVHYRQFYSSFGLGKNEHLGFRGTGNLPTFREEERAERFLYSRNSPKARAQELERLRYRQDYGWYRVHVKEGNLDKNWIKFYRNAYR